MKIRKPTDDQIKDMDANSGSQVRMGVREYLASVLETLRSEHLVASSQALPQAQGMAGACIALEQLQTILGKINERKAPMLHFPAQTPSPGLAAVPAPGHPVD